jgi:hypothetical protein
MLTKFRHASIKTQASVMLAFVLAGCLGAWCLLAIDRTSVAELSQARAAADLVDAFRMQASSNGGFYLRRDSSGDPATMGRYLETVDVVAPGADGVPRTYTFHQKHAFHALADLASELKVGGAAVQLRVVGGNNFNASSAPDAFEAQVLETLRASGDRETWAVADGLYRYVRPLRVTLGCLSCHGASATVPAALGALYKPHPEVVAARGREYQVGQLVGLTSIILPHESATRSLVGQSPSAWAAAALVVSSLSLGCLYVCCGLIVPLRRQARYAIEIARAKDPLSVATPDLELQPVGSRNELDRQLHALLSIHESVATLAERLRSRT